MHKDETIDIIIAPRSFDLMFFHIVGICFLVPGTLLLLIFTSSILHIDFKDLIIGITASSLPLSIGLVLIIVSQKKRARILISKDRKSITIIKPSTRERHFNIEQIISFHSHRITYPFPGMRNYKLNVIISENESINLFNEDLVTSASQWDIFAEKIARKVNKPLRKESWVEDESLFSSQKKVRRRG